MMELLFLQKQLFFYCTKTLHFFSGSTKRLEVVKEYVSQLALKPLIATRWSSRVDAAIRFQLCELCDALFQIEDVNRNAETKLKQEF
jgi:hypothetical protein